MRAVAVRRHFHFAVGFAVAVRMTVDDGDIGGRSLQIVLTNNGIDIGLVYRLLFFQLLTPPAT